MFVVRVVQGVSRQRNLKARAPLHERVNVDRLHAHDVSLTRVGISVPERMDVWAQKQNESIARVGLEGSVIFTNAGMVSRLPSHIHVEGCRFDGILAKLPDALEVCIANTKRARRKIGRVFHDPSRDVCREGRLRKKLCFLEIDSTFAHYTDLAAAAAGLVQRDWCIGSEHQASLPPERQSRVACETVIFPQEFASLIAVPSPCRKGLGHDKINHRSA